jgi:hypothetical protein
MMHDQATTPRFTVIAEDERFESDSFVEIVKQMLARGLSSDAVLTAALETCRRRHGEAV